MARQFGYFPVYVDGKWTGEWQRDWIRKGCTIADLRRASQYWIRDVERDLKPRTLKQVYAENHNNDNGRMSGYEIGQYIKGLKEEYLAWCKKRRHKPHPGSLDPEHPINKYRLRCPPRERVPSSGHTSNTCETLTGPTNGSSTGDPPISMASPASAASGISSTATC